MIKMSNSNATKKMLPPDGGWGWVVALACGLNNVVMVPLIQGMSLIFVDVFDSLKLPATQVTIITSTNMAFGMSMGLLHGPLLRRFGYRKVALTGSILFISGILMTTFANKFIHFFVCYGIMASFGIGLSMASFPLAVNTYFHEKRGRAMGLAMTLTGLGPTIMPQIISLLLYNYTSQGALLILGAISLHTFVAALLLQPIKWHTKRAVNEPEDNEELVKPFVEIEKSPSDIICSNLYEKKCTSSLTDLDDSVKNENLQALVIEDDTRSRVVQLRRNTVGKSLNSINLGSCPILFDDSMVYGTASTEYLNENNEYDKGIKNHQNDTNGMSISTQVIPTAVNGTRIEKEEETPYSQTYCKCLRKCLRNIVTYFDLSLLCDPIFVNIMLGLAIATFAEMNFTVLMGYMLHDINFTPSEIAISMSVMGAVDLIMRGFSPFVGEWLRQTPRIIYLLSLVIVIISRTILIYCSSFISVIIMVIGIGFAKGFRSVFTSLIIPSHVPLARLADATGIQTLVHGVILGALGPVMGIIKEARGSYRPCLVIMNAMSALTIVMWATEMLIVKRNSKKKELQKQDYKVVATKE